MAYLVITILVIGYWVMLTRQEVFERKEVCLGDTVEIECNISLHHDITWLKLNKEESPVVFMVTALITDGEISVIYQDKHLSGEASLKGRVMTLTINNISENHMGLYYCTRIKDKVLMFSTGILIQVSGNEKPVDSEKGPVLPSTGTALSPFTLAYTVVLVCGLLTMIGAVLAVHLQTRKKTAH